VRKAARRIVKGDSLAAICRDINDRGIRTARGGEWGVRGLRDVLTNPHYLNLRVLDGELVPGTWKPILSRTLYDQVQAVLADPDRRTNRGTTQPRWLLSGIVRCGKCGTPMGSGSTPKNGPRYRCKPRSGHDNACGHVSIDAVRLDEFVRGAVAQSFGADDVRDAYRAGNPEAVVDALEAEKKELARRYGIGEIDPADYWAALPGFDARLERAREIAATPRPVVIDIARFADEPIEAQRMFVQWAFTEISVRPWTPGTVGFDDTRITLTPRRREDAVTAAKPKRARRSRNRAA
jgi:hypothetical protein